MNVLDRRSFMTATASTTFLGGMHLAIAGDAELSVPPEEAPHTRTFMMWPTSRQVYEDAIFLEMTQRTIADIANAISDFEPVTLLASGERHAGMRRIVSEQVELWDVPTEDLWCRDAGPLFAVLSDNTLAVSHIQFNGWGKKQVHHHDARVATEIAMRLGLPIISSGLVGEAGGVEHDGRGLLMAHESSWVNPNRNPDLSRDEIGQRLLKAYGAEEIIWSGGVLRKDITDYHIDSLARFTGPGRVLINLPDEPDMEDPFHLAALDTHARLTEAGLDIDVMPEPMEQRVKHADFVASYVNYYACNGAILAAEFGDSRTDEIAKTKLTDHYPGREILTLNIDPLGELGGGIHCATQQMPAT